MKLLESVTMMDIKEHYKVWSINVWEKKTGFWVIASVNKQLAKELHQPVIKKFKRIKVNARFEDTIWSSCLAEMESLSSKKEKLNIVMYDRRSHYICMG